MTDHQDNDATFVRNHIRYLPWRYQGKAYVSEIVCDCPHCGAHAVIELPPILVAEQPDDTNYACHPMAGGCNYGFYLPPLPVAKEDLS